MRFPLPLWGSATGAYQTIDDLAADSAVIVIGNVVSQTTDENDTFSSVEVLNTPDNPKLNTEDDEAASVDVGDVIRVAQISDDSTDLRMGAGYVLFLNSAADRSGSEPTFTVTGEPAGLYEVDGDTATRVAADSALPETISIEGSPNPNPN